MRVKTGKHWIDLGPRPADMASGPGKPHGYGPTVGPAGRQTHTSGYTFTYGKLDATPTQWTRGHVDGRD